MAGGGLGPQKDILGFPGVSLLQMRAGRIVLDH